jgi:hypothetical protein
MGIRIGQPVLLDGQRGVAVGLGDYTIPREYIVSIPGSANQVVTEDRLVVDAEVEALLDLTSDLNDKARDEVMREVGRYVRRENGARAVYGPFREG